MRQITIGGTVVDDSSPAFTIAEIGSNGAADTELTKRFIDAAAQAGASAVKLQKRQNETLYARSMLEQSYVHENSFGATYGEHRAALEYTGEQMLELCQYTHSKGISFGVTPFDPDSADLLARVGVDFLKIASATITDTVLLEHCAKLGLPMVVSTGTANQHDVDMAVSVIVGDGCPLAVLQCTASYPLSDPSILNLRVIETYRGRYPRLVTGLSSHYSGLGDVETAYVLGGRIFEKHFTLDRTMRGADHAFSLEPHSFLNMVGALAMVQQALGSPVKTRLPEEHAAIVKMGKVLRAARDLPAGHVLTRSDISIKSPGSPGIPPSRLAEMIGRTLMEPLAEDESLPEVSWYR